MRNKRTTGFTLAEALVIVAIVAILAVILVPALTGVRTKAGVSRCLSHLRKIGIALQMYANNHGGMLPYNPYHIGEQERQKSSTVEIWRGSDKTAVGLGLLPVDWKAMTGARLLHCWGDRYHDEQDYEGFGVTDQTLRSSYVYRCYCEGMGPRLDQKGKNSRGRAAVALVMDFNCLDIGNGRRAMNHNAKTITILFKDLHVEKIPNPHGMELYKQKVGDDWVFAPFPLVLEKDDPTKHPTLWIAADEVMRE